MIVEEIIALLQKCSGRMKVGYLEIIYDHEKESEEWHDIGGVKEFDGKIVIQLD